MPYYRADSETGEFSFAVPLTREQAEQLRKSDGCAIVQTDSEGNVIATWQSDETLA